MKADRSGESGNDRVVRFREWSEVLEGAAVAPALKAVYRQEIVAFLHFCKIHHAGASIMLVKQYLAVAETQGRIQAREALRWWFRAAKGAVNCGPSTVGGAQKTAVGAHACFAAKYARPQPYQDGTADPERRSSGTPPQVVRRALERTDDDARNVGRCAPTDQTAFSANAATAERQAGTPALRGEGVPTREDPDGSESHPYPRTRNSTPPRAAEDLGGADWERDLIKASRGRGFLWRTEQTYRQWAGRFAAFLRPRSPYVATKDDVGAFLSKLAVEQRASASTQKQALNAIVFLLQEALHHELGEFDFNRAQPRKRVPTVLSPDECQRFFAQLTGTPRLMAELAYGAGLRLMELIRLRVHHLDLDRLQVQVHGGKGDKDRVTVLPEALVESLREHLGRLRVLFKQDREEERSGVWLPEGLARKYPKAGVSWEWQWLFPSRELSIDPVSGVLRRHHVQDGAVQGFVRRAAQAAGIDKRVTPHTLRHSFGTHMMETGYDICTVQELMGHEKVETTQIYTHVMRKGLGSVSPLDKLKGRVPSPKPGLINPNWPLPPGGGGTVPPTT